MSVHQMKHAQTPKVSLDLVKVFDTRCSLGEGIFVQDNISAWADINSNHLYHFKNNLLIKSKVKSKPSVIFDCKKSSITFGADIGLVNFNYKDDTESILLSVAEKHNLNDYRSNDGGFCGGHQYLSFMHRFNPDIHPGFIYRVLNKSWSLVEDSLHIPNTFIEIEKGQLLISDSLNGEVWLYDIDKQGKIIKKDLWKKFEYGSSPDGGCLINNLVFITLWDGASIAVLDKRGNVIDRITMPVVRPTNCKFDSDNSMLWVTSASEGLTKKELEKYPQSGNTMVYKLKINN